MKFFVDRDYDEYGLSLTPVKKAKGEWLRQNGIVYDIPKRLARRYKYALEACEAAREQIDEILDGQEGEPSPYRNEDNRPKPKITTSIFQLRHVKTRVVMVEVSVPVGNAFEWSPQPGWEPDGECQWWASFVNEEGTQRREFVAIGSPIRYDGRKIPNSCIFDPRNYDDNPHPD